MEKTAWSGDSASTLSNSATRRRSSPGRRVYRSPDRQALARAGGSAAGVDDLEATDSASDRGPRHRARNAPRPGRSPRERRGAWQRVLSRRRGSRHGRRPCRARPLQTSPHRCTARWHRFLSGSRAPRRTSEKAAIQWQRFLSRSRRPQHRGRDRRRGLQKTGPVDEADGQAAQLPPRDEIALRVGLRPPWRALCGRAADLCEAVVLVPGRDAVDGDVGQRLRIEVRGSRGLAVGASTAYPDSVCRDCR